jgi:shikimate kinase
VVLTGFMGAGKSTVGALLAARLGWQFTDVDAAIEAFHGASVAALFEQHGEPWFRQVERATILDFLGIDHLVLALGGGAIEDERTRELLLASAGTRLVHLEASLDTVLLRCSGTEDVRPVLRDKLNLESRYARRLPLYRQAHLSLPVDAVDAETVTATLCSLLSLG